jgi:hypothetical protein
MKSAPLTESRSIFRRNRFLASPLHDKLTRYAFLAANANGSVMRNQGKVDGKSEIGSDNQHLFRARL